MSTHPELDHFRREGWQGQLERVERWHRRALEALDQSSGGLGDYDVIDYLYAFFQAAYHLRDWLQNSGAATKADLDTLMACTPALSLCRAICNGSKHLVLDGRHQTAHVRLMQEYVPPSLTNPSGGARVRLLGFEDRAGNVNYEYVQTLLHDTLLAWRNYCASLRPMTGP